MKFTKTDIQASLEEFESKHRSELKAKEDELDKMRRDVEEMLQRHSSEIKVLKTVIHKFDDRMPKQPTSWLKIQRATSGQPVVGFT